MENTSLQIVIELLKLITTPNIEQYIKEKTIKKLVCESVDIQPNYGERTKEELKFLINAAKSEIELLEAVLTYISTHDCTY